MSTESWTIRVDADETLMFASYVGEKENFHLLPENAASTVEIEWLTWWQNLPKIITAISTRNAEFMQSLSKTKTRQEFSFTPPNLEEFSWLPPNFYNLKTQPELQALLKFHWTEFQRNSATYTLNMIKISQTISHKVPMATMVQECTRLKGKNQPNPFHLRIDLISWPKNYNQQITENHFVISVDYSQNLDIFSNFLKEKICLLV